VFAARRVPTVLCLIALLAAAPTRAATPAATPRDTAPAIADEEWLLAELARIDPPARLRELAAYQAWQAARGGGFHGLLPDPSDSLAVLPPPEGAAGRRAAARALLRLRDANRAALAAAHAEYVHDFTGAPVPAFAGEAPVGLTIALDTAAVRGFLDALADGRVDSAEAARLAALPANARMLRHRRDLGYVPPPLPDAGDLAAMIARAGSPDPLDRIWCRLQPLNCFGYADLAVRRGAYADFLARLAAGEGDLLGAARDRVARYAPPGTVFEGRFALTVGALVRGWVTPEQAGLNIEQVKDDWDLLLGTLVEETYHQLQVVLCPRADGGRAAGFGDLVAADLDDPRQERLYELLATTVLEGTANRARGDAHAAALRARVADGGALLDAFVERVVRGGDVAAADSLIGAGLRGNGPLYALGWHLAGRIEEAEGPAAVGVWLSRGVVPFFRQAAGLDVRARGGALSARSLRAVDDLAVRLFALEREKEKGR